MLSVRFEQRVPGTPEERSGRAAIPLSVFPADHEPKRRSEEDV
jgi:hypothetical protein